MIKKIILCFLTMNTLISCNIESESSTNEINLNDYIIQLNDLYNIENDEYSVYFSSSYCPACNSLTNDLINFIKNENRCIENFYIVDLTNTSEEDFNKMKSGNAMFDEEIINSTINATSLEQTYFKNAPSLYFFEKIDSTNTLTNLILNYSEIQNIFINNEIN